MAFILLLLVLASVHLYNVRRAPFDGPIAPMTIVGLSLVFYAVTVPIELRLRDATTIGFTRHDMPPEVGTKVLLAAAIGLLALYAGHSFASGREALPEIERGGPQIRKAERVLLLVSVLCMVLLATAFRENVLASRDYLENVAQTAAGSGATAYFVINRWAYLSYGMFAFLRMTRARRPHTAMFYVAPLVAWSVFSNDKDPLLVAALALIAFINVRHADRGWRIEYLTWFFTVLVILSLAVGALLYGENRAGRAVGDLTLTTVIVEGLFVNIDPAGPSVVNALEFQKPGGTGSLAPTLLAPVAWLPSILRPFAVPQELAVTFAQQYWPGWRPGYGYGYSPLAEGWQGAGWLGVVLLMAFIGILFGIARKRLLRAPSVQSPAFFVRYAAYYVVIGYLAFTLMRGSLLSLVSTSVICFLLVLIGAALARKRESQEDQGARRPATRPARASGRR